MLLAMDIGNSEISIGLFNEEGRLQFSAGVLTDRSKTAAQCAIELKSLFELYHEDILTVDGAIISSVVPPLTDKLAQAVRLLTGCRAMVLGPGIKTGLNIRTQSHSELGEDIVACAVGAVMKYKPPFIIVDFGTAITFSAVAEDCSFLGGAIYPGVQIAAEALSRRTAMLPQISLKGGGKAIGRNTIDAMQAGMLYGTAGAVERTVEALRAEIGDNATVIATGERLDYIFRKCRLEMTFDETLLLDGLYHIYIKNC